jgi:predicted amidohydrolase
MKILKDLTQVIFLVAIILIPFHAFPIGDQLLDGSVEWQFACQRPELMPGHKVDNSVVYEKESTLMISGDGSEIANGHWFVNVDVEAEQWYEFNANFMMKDIEEPFRSVLARILWYDKEGKQVERAEYPMTTEMAKEGQWNRIGQLYRVPENVVYARVELIYRWDADGMVWFGGVSLDKTHDPGQRIVRLAAVHHRPRNTSGPKENLQQFADLINQAAGNGADIVCLPEGATLAGTGLNYISASETIPGPSTNFLGEIARMHELYIIAGILEKDGNTVYNTAVLIDRDGSVAGKYRKVSLPREEIEGGVTPGSEFPVFDTDFGRIGMMICWDVTFPEAARTLAFKGAEVIFLPIWGGHLTLAKARALENQVYLVSSTYSMKTAVFDREGEIMKEATTDNPVIVVEVDLNQRKYWPWLGDLKNRIKREVPGRKALLVE